STAPPLHRSTAPSSGFRCRRWLPRPRVIATIEVGQTLVDVHLELRELLPLEIVPAQIEPRVRAPHFGGIDEVLRGAIGEREARADGQHATRPIAEDHGNGVAAGIWPSEQRVHRLIEVRVLEEPLAVEPVEPFAADV